MPICPGIPGAFSLMEREEAAVCLRSMTKLRGRNQAMTLLLGFQMILVT
jgi:hypothetical protein